MPEWLVYVDPAAGRLAVGRFRNGGNFRDHDSDAELMCEGHGVFDGSSMR